MKRSIILLAALMLAMPVLADQLVFGGVDYTTSEGKQFDADTKFIGFAASYYNFMRNDWFVGLEAGFGQGDSSICIQSSCLDLDSEYTEFGLEIGYTLGYMTPFIGASRGEIESEVSAGGIANLEIEGDSSTVARLGLWAGAEAWRIRLALEDAEESRAVSVGGFSKIGSGGLAVGGFFESPLDSDTAEGYSVRLQIGFMY